MHRILIIEDNEIIANNTAEFLRMEGFHVTVSYHGEKGFEELQFSARDGKPYALVILDRMLPGLDGLSIARLIRTKQIPTRFLFLTAKNKQIDINEGLEIGGQDYLVKPFDLDELALRIRNILERNTHAGSGQEDERYTIGDLSIDVASHQIERDATKIELSPKEYAILVFLLRRKGKIVTQEEIFQEVWNDYGSRFSDASETINVHIAYLRRKVGKDIIRTVKGSGYIID